ncbi:kinase-like domain-containing protein [Rhizophagus clarus]|uniref:Kinase-like domain-containing protein n=1 Tax=Rhizophagus clarus TaxID=94130 RepID=A0A8H3LX93_9GLOM|nr:kinase-like domain-containing protein [Rhizophagus clarus]
MVLCKKCGGYFDEWCKSCQLNDLKKNFKNWTSRNKKIDNLIREMQLKINSYNDSIFEWIPYYQFHTVKKVNRSLYTIIWKDGPLCYNTSEGKYIRKQNESVILKYLYDPQNVINEVKSYDFNNLYGISQNLTKSYIIVLKDKYCVTCGKEYTSIDNKWCKLCLINELNFKYRINGNEKIESCNDTIFEWIPYSQFENIKEGKQNKSVILKHLYDPQNVINEVKSYDFNDLYGLCQNLNTKSCFIVLRDKYCVTCGEEYTSIDNKWCKLCLMNDLNLKNWTSGNEEIDNLIHEMQLKIKTCDDTIFEWIPYSQKKYIRCPNENVNLKYSYDYKNIINEVKLSHHFNELYGISQDPITKNYFIVLKDTYHITCDKEYMSINNELCRPCLINDLNLKNWTSGSEKIDNFIQEIQLKINSHKDTIFEWIPYNQFSDFIFMSELCIAIWKDDPLYFDIGGRKYTRNEGKKVALKYVLNVQDIVDEYSIYDRVDIKIFGISRNPDTKDYIFVLEDVYCIKCAKKYTIKDTKWCSTCKIRYSGNAIIDDLIQKIQTKIGSYDTFEWIPYDQFNNIKEIDKGKVYLALWKNGSLHYYNKNEYKTIQYEKVALKCICNLHNITNEFSKMKTHSDCKIYGISQNPDTENYFMVLEIRYYRDCDQCADDKLCEMCRINYFKKSFTDCNNENEKIDNLIEKMQLKNGHNGIVFEWIPYNQFNNIKEMDKCDFINIYSAVWENGPSYYGKNKYIRNKNKYKRVTLKDIYNSQDITNEFLNEYGIQYSQNEVVDKLIREMQVKINSHDDIIFEWVPYSLFDNIREVGKGGFATVKAYSVSKYATGKQPFSKCAHDQYLALNICNGIRPEINEPEVPKCYEAEEYRKSHLTSFDDNERLTTHPQAFYTSRLLNPYTKDLPKDDNPKDDNICNNSLEVIDFTEL